MPSGIQALIRTRFFLFADHASLITTSTSSFQTVPLLSLHHLRPSSWKKKATNWILWVVINIISIGVYAAQGVYAMSLEYLILLFIAANGTRLWVIAAKRQPQGL